VEHATLNKQHEKFSCMFAVMLAADLIVQFWSCTRTILWLLLSLQQLGFQCFWCNIG